MNKFILVLVFALVACDMDIDAIMFQQFQNQLLFWLFYFIHIKTPFE